MTCVRKDARGFGCPRRDCAGSAAGPARSATSCSRPLGCPAPRWGRPDRVGLARRCLRCRPPTPLGETFEAAGRVASAYRRHLGPGLLLSPWQLLSQLTNGRFLAPAAAPS
jgi:hypothetical protein